MLREEDIRKNLEKRHKVYLDNSETQVEVYFE